MIDLGVKGGAAAPPSPPADQIHGNGIRQAEREFQHPPMCGIFHSHDLTIFWDGNSFIIFLLTTHHQRSGPLGPPFTPQPPEILNGNTKRGRHSAIGPEFHVGITPGT